MKLSAPIYQLKRRAKAMARERNIPLNRALDRIARDEGFARWSLLAAQVAARETAGDLLSRLSEGDMVLLGARPGQGKTRLGLKLLLDAVRAGRQGVFFTLEYTRQETDAIIRSLEGAPEVAAALEVVTSDEICAEYVIRHLSGAPRGTVAVIDYLQILDQCRSKPVLSEQMTSLQGFARATGAILAFISQIDRSYNPDHRPLPGMQDIRLPNKIDVGLFSKALFVQDGKAQFRAWPD